MMQIKVLKSFEKRLKYIIIKLYVMVYDSFVYLLIEREFISSKQNVFKIGKSIDVMKRFRSYPKGSKLLSISLCKNHHNSEKHLKKVFMEKFIHREDIGQEYFEGDLYDVVDTFHQNCEIQDIESFNCKYCHKSITRKCRLYDHEGTCKMKYDDIRMLEIELDKKVKFDHESVSCRFCHNGFCNVKSRRRHEVTCREKLEYKQKLLNERSSRVLQNNSRKLVFNIDNSAIIDHNIMNYEHNYSHVSIEDILKCLKLSTEKNEDVLSSLVRFIRYVDKNDKSIIVTNMRGKMVKAFEDGQYVSKDARHAISHRGQEAAYRLDSAKDEAGEEHHPLWRNKDFGDIESTLTMVTESTTDKEVNRVYEAVKMAIYDANRCLELS
jgi:hypothetical protein